MGLMWLTMSLALAPVAAAGEETKKPADESPANDRPGEMITFGERVNLLFELTQPAEQALATENINQATFAIPPMRLGSLSMAFPTTTTSAPA